MRIGSRALARPDPRAGVFETILVRDGRPVGVERHLARLGASAAALYGRRLPTETAEIVAAAGLDVPDGRARLRLTARPRDGGLELTARTSPISDRRPAIALRTVTIAGGLGPHKWADRRLVEALERRVAPAQPALCDLDGSLLEGSRSNVFVVDTDGRLSTPPVDGRLLPGVTRAAIISIARRLGLGVAIEEISPARLLRAAEVFVSGSVRGVEPVESLDGRPIGPPGPVGLTISAWLDRELPADRPTLPAGARARSAQAGTDSASPAASRSASALFVCSQVKSSSSRPKWP